MFRLTEYCAVELEVKRSKFLTEGFPIKTAHEAREIIKAQKEKYKDATHLVHAFSVGKDAEVVGSSDDGEPSGTAGAPALKVLTGENVTDTLITIARWFGGTLLGTGGLVKAYGGSVKALLENANLKKIIPSVKLKFRLSYADYETVKKDFPEFELKTENTDFAVAVESTVIIPEKYFDEFSHYLKNATGGRAEILFVENLD